MTKRLGDGTFGEVLLAKKIDTGDKGAIKRFEHLTSVVSNKHPVHFSAI